MILYYVIQCSKILYINHIFNILYFYMKKIKMKIIIFK